MEGTFSVWLEFLFLRISLHISHQINSRMFHCHWFIFFGNGAGSYVLWLVLLLFLCAIYAKPITIKFVSWKKYYKIGGQEILRTYTLCLIYISQFTNSHFTNAHKAQHLTNPSRVWQNLRLWGFQSTTLFSQLDRLQFSESFSFFISRIIVARIFL
jgi:hypothetical protein